jgi:hypothetical protein
MTPIEWNDSEPGFPDHLPPKPEPRKLTQAEVQRRIKGVLEAAGIECLITGRISAEFPDGAKCSYTPLCMETDARGYLGR